MGGIGRGILLGAGALGAYGVVSALMDGNDVPLPDADHELARTNAKKTIDSIDWSRPNIVIVAAPTGWVKPADELSKGLVALAGADKVSAVELAYPAAATDMAQSVALGKETLRLVLEEIERRDPTGTKYHVALNGESQGAWLINDLLAEAPFRATVDRAGLYGLPASATHDHAHGNDARVRVTNHPLDPIAWNYLGPGTVAARSSGFILGGNWADGPAAALQIALNPVHAAVFGVGELMVRSTGVPGSHPHLYTEHYEGEGARFLLEDAPGVRR